MLIQDVSKCPPQEEGDTPPNANRNSVLEIERDMKHTSSGPKNSTPSANEPPTNICKAQSVKSLATPSRVRKKKPTYLEMVHDAILALKDRTGSSVPAISKWISIHNVHAAQSSNASMFKNRVSTAIKQGVKDGRFTKVKNSYKINSEWTKKQKKAARAKEAAKKKLEKQRQKDTKKANQQKKEMAKRLEEKKQNGRFAPEEKAEEVARKRKAYIEQQLRKRRYPLEDTKLHREDKEWGVKSDVLRRPTLPYTLTCLVPPHLRESNPKKCTDSISNESASGNGALLGGENERGLVTDAIHVYHFFSGDVGHGAAAEPPVPKFSLKTLFHALDEVLNGNAKASRSLPPLITHLFVTALRMLTAPQQEPVAADLSPGESRLREDLSKLREGLNAISWSQVCYFYIDLMERYYTSDILIDEGFFPVEDKLNMSYFWKNEMLEKEDIDTGEMNGPPSTKRNSTYLREAQLVNAYSKLQNQAEPWTLKAKELMALLRTLTDDILARIPNLAEDITVRGEKLKELLKAKRNALIKFNKVRLAYEGQKNSLRPKKSDKDRGKDKDKENKDEQDKHKSHENDEKNDQASCDPTEEIEKTVVPTATQFVAAEKAYNKAAEAYETGLNKLISRTEPVAFDRNFNAIYLFRSDPTMLHIEQLRKSSLPPELKMFAPENPLSSWHIIDTKPLFEHFLASLDRRGQREDEALNTCAGLTVLKRRLLDEKKENTRAVAREREKEQLQKRLESSRRRLENWQSAICDSEDGRRRPVRRPEEGRMAKEDELKDLEKEVKCLTKVHEEEEQQEKKGRQKASDYSLLTGLQLVVDLFVDQRATRSSKKSDCQSDVTLLANIPSHKLWMDEQIGGNGTLNALAQALLGLEERCNDLSPWARLDITREAWRRQLSDASCAWAVNCVMKLGPSADTLQEKDSSESLHTVINPTKKQKVDSVSSRTSHANVVNLIKFCLRDLELRLFEISFKKKSTEEAEITAEDDAEICRRRNCWKSKINALGQLPSNQHVHIHDIIVAAITASRKSHLNQVAAELKAALQMLRPQAAGKAKSAAIQVLEKYGGNDGSGKDGEDVDFDDSEEAEAIVTSLLCEEVRMINGSVGGDDFADKSDWSTAIKNLKSLARAAFILQSFLLKADVTLNQMKEERKNLDTILGLNAKRTSFKSTISTVKKHVSNTSIWCDVELTNKLVKARVKGYPWWPAQICIPRETVVADALKGSGYTLISSVGNPSLFMVNEKDIIEFTEETNENLSKYDKFILDELHKSVSIANKLQCLQNVETSLLNKKSTSGFVGENTSHGRSCVRS